MLNKTNFIILIFLIFIGAILNAQDVKSDTNFLLKENVNGIEHIVFIEDNSESDFYNQISDFEFGPFDKEFYCYSLDFLKELNLELSRKEITGLPLKWIVLKQLNGKFYSYKPSDFMSHYQISITDTAFIDYASEGPHGNKIIRFEILDSNTYLFELTGSYGTERKLIIHIIDHTNKIAVFEETFAEGEIEYKLMISADKIRNFPIIVNYCENQKQREVVFDKPNYKKLIKRKPY